MRIELKINDLDISNSTIDANFSTKRNGGTIQTTMQILLKGDTNALKYIDLRGNLKLRALKEDQLQPFFEGVINSAIYDGSAYLLQCTDATQLLQEAKMGGGFGPGILPAEVIYYLAKQSGGNGADPKNFAISDTKSLADTSYFSRPRRFVYIAPLPSCVLREGTGTLKMANSWIYTVADSGAADDKIISLFQDEAWQNSETRVRFYIQATNFLEALEKGRVRLQRLLDVLSFGANYASATYGKRKDISFFDYDRTRTLVDIEQTQWAFMRDTGGAERYWMHWSAPHRARQPFSLGREDPIVSLYEIFQTLAESDDEDLSGKDRALLNALHALHQVRQSADAKDALGHVWRCMEFLLAGYSTPSLFSDTERKAILKAAKAVIDEQAHNPLREEQKKRLENILNQQLNQTPLRTTWKVFCADHALEFPRTDEDFLWMLRRNRNHHQHGRSMEVARTDVDRAATIMEKALVAAIMRISERIESL